MPSRILYFPYINVPSSAWLMRMLLYWDEVGTIAPLEYLQNPKHFDAVTLDLVKRNLITPIIPGYHLEDFPEFSSRFVEFIGSLPVQTIDDRRNNFVNDQKSVVTVHYQKLEDLGEVLVSKGLASRKDGSWYFVERKTSEEFMAYLAAILSFKSRKKYTPMTDSSVELDYVFNSSSSRAESKLRPIRYEFLNDIFPLPMGTLSPRQIDEFKTKHYDKLRSLRRAIEQRVLEIASIVDDDLRRHASKEFSAQIQDDVNELRNEMKRQLGKGATTLGRICFTVAAKLSKTVGITKAILGTIPDGPEKHSGPLLYAAYAQSELSLDAGSEK